MYLTMITRPIEHTVAHSPNAFSSILTYRTFLVGILVACFNGLQALSITRRMFQRVEKNGARRLWLFTTFSPPAECTKALIVTANSMARTVVGICWTPNAVHINFRITLFCTAILYTVIPILWLVM
jgi:hypothetical protein